MKKLSIVLVSSAVLLAACGYRTPTPTAPQDPITQALVGKTLTSPGSKIQLQEFNKMVGTAGPNGNEIIDGAWEIRNGEFCRTLTSPAQLAGTECQDITIDGDTATIVGRNGPVTYIIADS